MNATSPRQRPLSRSLPFCLSAGVLLTAAAGCSDAGAQGAPSGETSAIADAPLDAWRTDLLDLAFRTASALPADPHIKSRSQAQESVVAACLALEQPRRALACIERIDGWRRGVGYADYALYCARKGASAEAQRYLERAGRVADARATDETEQEWRIDTIRAKIAQGNVLLGRTGEAAALAAAIEERERSRIRIAEAMVASADDEAFDAQVAALDRIIATSDLDQVRHALEAYAELLDRFWDDEARRALVRQKIEGGITVMPAMIGIEVLGQAAETALAHGDGEAARAMLARAEGLLGAHEWLAEHRVPLMARVAVVWHRAGEDEVARRRLEAARARFEEGREKIFDFYRGGVLRPIAEAYEALGDEATALSIYQVAVEEGATNPNARPRAEDLCATCVSMALHDVRPNAELLDRMREIHAGLGDPW